MIKNTIFLFLFLTISFNLVGQNESSTHDLGTFSISLNVKDIKTSYKFYQQMGFRALEGAGGIDQKWIILQNGSAQIGLFEGMFPNNLITFNPLNARKIHHSLTEQDISFTYSMGFEKEAGPCSFTVMDPDGNTLLFDQH